MAGGNVVRRLRGAFGNALVWGAGWFAAAFVVMAVLRLTGNAPASASWVGALRSALMFAVMGTIAGTAFATFIGLRYRGHRLSEISWVRFGIGGGIVTGLFVPAFIMLMRLLSGDAPLPFEALFRNGTVGLVFGGAAAGGSLKLAQLATSRLPDRSQDQPDLLEGADRSAFDGKRDTGET